MEVPSYCEAPACWPAELLDHFGERVEPWGNCDVCLDPAERLDGTRDLLLGARMSSKHGQR